MTDNQQEQLPRDLIPVDKNTDAQFWISWTHDGYKSSMPILNETACEINDAIRFRRTLAAAGYTDAGDVVATLNTAAKVRGDLQSALSFVPYYSWGDNEGASIFADAIAKAINDLTAAVAAAKGGENGE